MVPGVSRSGATIVGALMLGVDKRAAAEFSFFLSLPTMGAAVAYDLFKNRDCAGFFGRWNQIAVGFALAFRDRRSSWCAGCWAMSSAAMAMRLFGWWRIIVGGGALVALWLGFWTRFGIAC